MLKRLYLVVGIVEHEYTTPLRAFRRKDQAEAFAGKLRVHAAKMPLAKDFNDDYDVYEAALNAWAKRCPGGPANRGFDIYTVEPLPFMESAPSVRGSSGGD